MMNYKNCDIILQSDLVWASFWRTLYASGLLFSCHSSLYQLF